MANNEPYWAADDSKPAVSALVDRIKRYQESLSVSGRLEKMQRAWLCYKGKGPRGDSEGSRLINTGSSGELIGATVNHFAALVNQSVTLITSNKPATKAIASNSDFESLAQAQLADAINEHYDRELNLSDVELQCVRNMALFGEAAEVLGWDTSAGRRIAPPEGEPGAEAKPSIPQGDVEAMALTPLDYAYDPDTRQVKARTWVAFRRPVNIFDLAAQYPDKADAIRASADYNQLNKANFGLSINAGDFFAISQRRTLAAQSDVLMVWEFRHIPTAACPNGRLIIFTDESCILFDSRTTTRDEMGQQVVNDFGSPFKTLNVEFVAPERLPGTDEGNTSFFDLLSMQESIDLAASIMASAINAGGLQNLYVQRGSNITADRLTGALTVISYDGNQLPVAKDNLAINPVVPAWIDQNIGWMRQRVGSNDVASGEPSKGMPAQAMALLRATAVEFHSGMQNAFEKLIQRSRTGVLHLLQKFATTERIALVAGKANQWTLKYFKADDISSFDRFVIEPVNPTMKTLAGKVAFAQPLLDTGKIKLDEYLQLVATGRLDPIMHGERDNYARIQQEKELLMQGIGLPPIQQSVDPMTGAPMPAVDINGLPIFAPGTEGEKYVRPMVTDTHWIDIPEYLGVLAIPGLRSVASVVKAVTEVVDLKLRMYRAMPPDLIMLLGGPPPVMAAPPLGAPPSSSPAGGPPSSPAPNGAQGPDIAPPKLPQPPKNPITHQQDQHTDIKQ